MVTVVVNRTKALAFSSLTKDGAADVILLGEKGVFYGRFKILFSLFLQESKSDMKSGGFWNPLFVMDNSCFDLSCSFSGVKSSQVLASIKNNSLLS